MTSAYQLADSLLKSEIYVDIDAMQEKLSAMESSMQGSYETLQSAVALIETRLEQMNEELRQAAAEGDQKNADALEEKIEKLTAAAVAVGVRFLKRKRSGMK